MQDISMGILHEQMTSEELLQFQAVSGYVDRIHNKIVLYYKEETDWKQALHLMTDYRLFNLLKKIVAATTDDDKYLLEAYFNT